jgi:sigma-B regulation protein RsbQ
MVFIHGYGCDQSMWRFVLPAFTQDFKTITYDMTGFGRSDVTAYDRMKYRTLQGHADDLLEILDELELPPAVIVGHSVSAMTAVLAANRNPGSISAIVMVAPSPSYLNDDGYSGGFDQADVEDLLDLLDTNQPGWSNKMAPAVMGAPQLPELTQELDASFCRMDPEIARHFGRVTFLSDHRADVKLLQQPAFIMQCADDVLAPVEVGKWLQRNMQNGELALLQATGHCPHLSAPVETVNRMLPFVRRVDVQEMQAT